MKAYIEILEFNAKDVITTSPVVIPPVIWGDGNTTPPTVED